MSLYADKSVEVEKTDNGYVLTWQTERFSLNQPGQMPTQGREVFTDRKKLMKRLDALL